MMYTPEIWRSYETLCSDETGKLHTHVANKYAQSFLFNYLKNTSQTISDSAERIW